MRPPDSAAAFDQFSFHLVEELLGESDPPPTIVRVFGGPERTFETGIGRWVQQHHTAPSEITYVALAQTSASALLQTIHQPAARNSRAIILDTFDQVEHRPDLQKAITEAVYTCKQTRTPFFSASHRDPRDLHLEGELSKLVNDEIIAVKDWRGIELRRQLHDRLDDLSAVVKCPKIVEQLALACLEILNVEEACADRTIVNSVTGLRLPPRRRMPFTGRSAKYGLKISLEDFVRLEWGDYIQHHLLYTEHLRQIDFPLYKGCYYQARQQGVSFADYVLSLGMLAKEHVLKPPPGCERAAELMQKARLRTYAQRLRALADEIDGPLNPRRIEEILESRQEKRAYASTRLD